MRDRALVRPLEHRGRSYGLADLGDRKCVSLSLWETHKEADAAVPPKGVGWCYSRAPKLGPQLGVTLTT